jgi:hypothetical protein
MAENAIQQDVEEPTTEEGLSPQESEIDRIAEKVIEARAEELEGDETSEDERFEPAGLPSGPLVERDGEWYAQARVDGDDVHIPYHEVLAQFQKNSAADKRLQEASERQQELRDYEAQLDAYRANLEAQTRQPPSGAEPSPSVTDANTDDLYGQYHEALFQGDETKANAMLRQIRVAERPVQPEIDVNSIIERTKAEMREEETTARANAYESRRQEAVELFRSEYPEIAEDPGLLAVADRRSAELYNTDPTRDPWDIMQECAGHAREWLFNYVDVLGGEGGKETRAERKQGLGDEVTPRNVRASIGENAQTQTYSDIIKEMKEERGQIL